MAHILRLFPEVVAAFDGECFQLSGDSKASLSRSGADWKQIRQMHPVGSVGFGPRLVLLPPMVRWEKREIPAIPADELLAAAAEGLLWQQLFPDEEIESSLLGWRRICGAGGQRDRLLIALACWSQVLPDLRSLKALQKAFPGWVFVVAPGTDRDSWRTLSPGSAMEVAGAPWLSNPWPRVRIMRGLAGCAVLCILGLGMAVTAWVLAVNSPVSGQIAGEEIAEQQRRNDRLGKDLDVVRQKRRARDSLHQTVALQNRYLQRLPSAMPGDLHLRQLILDPQGISLIAEAGRENAFGEMANLWLPEGPSLGLKSVRRVSGGRFVFSAAMQMSPKTGEK